MTHLPRVRLSDLWRWDGTVGRGPYTLIGVVGFAIKHNLDRFIASAVFHRPWGAFNYVIPPGKAIQITSLPAGEARFLLTMVAAAFPFIWIGIALTLRRLRDVGFPTWLVAIFFLPVINLALFILLALIPSRGEESFEPGQPRLHFLGRFIPQTTFGSAVMAVLLTTLVGAVLTKWSLKTFSRYGWGLFVGLPFCLGLLSVLLYAYHRPRSRAACLSVALASVLLLGAALLALAVEGVICLAMAAPIGITLAVFGGGGGYLIQRRPAAAGGATAAIFTLLLSVPLLMGAEQAQNPAAPLFAVRTALEIDAAPERVWKNVVAFADLPEPREWIFRAGIAYPKKAKIFGEGVGAERHCVFSTGSFVEPIQVWDEPRLLKFSVTQNPPPMQEWTPYRYIRAPHLRGFLVSEGGQFLLTPLPGGRTRLEGTTWYRHHMWPAAYWRLWSDSIIRAIHLRVLKHIQRLSESHTDVLNFGLMEDPTR